MNDYINDAFTREGENTNLEINNLNVGCITSKNNKFELDSNGNLVVNSLTAQTINSLAITNSIYPVGSIYLSVNDTNPGILFGGVWEQLKDRFLLGCGDTYQNGTIDGEASHKLTLEEIPSDVVSGYCPDERKQWATGTWGNYSNYEYGVNILRNSQFVGDKSHNNMPPYLAVYMWKRVS